MFFLDVASGFCYECSDVMGIGSVGLPYDLVRIVHLIYNVIKIAVPLLLILIGMFDMGKAVTQQKEEDIKKAQGLLVKKAIAAALVFLMLSIVSVVFSVVAGDNNTDMWTCVNSLLNGVCTAAQPS